MVGLVTGATFASFSDTEESNNNQFTSGTLNLIMGSTDPAISPLITMSNLKPGDVGTFTLSLSNAGNVDGSQLTLGFDPSWTDKENTCHEPEVEAGDASCGAGNTAGELNNNMRFTLKEGNVTVPGGSNLRFSNPFWSSISLGSLPAGTTKVYNLVYRVENNPCPNLSNPAQCANRIMSDEIGFSLVSQLSQ